MEEKTKVEKLSYKDKLKFANPISKPMASKSMTKRLMKLIKKGKSKIKSKIFNFNLFEGYYV